MLTKSLPAKVKAVGAADGLDEGEFIAIVSVFGNVDSGGDVVVQGAFEDDLKAWAEKGDPIPVVWSHDWRDPFAHLGTVVKAEEQHDGDEGGGLLVRGRIEDLAENPKAAQVYRLLKGRRVTQFSFAYDILDGGWGKRGDREVFELRKLHVFEVGPTLVGMNQETELLAAKTAQLAGEAKAGVVLDARELRRLKAAQDDIAAILAAAGEADHRGAKISDNPANPQRAGVPDLDVEPGVLPGTGSAGTLPADPPDGRSIDEGSGIVSAPKAADADSTTSSTGQDEKTTAADSTESAKSDDDLDPAQVRAWADLQLTLT